MQAIASVLSMNVASPAAVTASASSGGQTVAASADFRGLLEELTSGAITTAEEDQPAATEDSASGNVTVLLAMLFGQPGLRPIAEIHDLPQNDVSSSDSLAAIGPSRANGPEQPISPMSQEVAMPETASSLSPETLAQPSAAQLPQASSLPEGRLSGVGLPTEAAQSTSSDNSGARRSSDGVAATSEISDSLSGANAVPTNDDPAPASSSDNGESHEAAATLRTSPTPASRERVQSTDVSRGTQPERQTTQPADLVEEETNAIPRLFASESSQLDGQSIPWQQTTPSSTVAQATLVPTEPLTGEFVLQQITTLPETQPIVSQRVQTPVQPDSVRGTEALKSDSIPIRLVPWMIQPLQSGKIGQAAPLAQSLPLRTGEPLTVISDPAPASNEATAASAEAVAADLQPSSIGKPVVAWRSRQMASIISTDNQRPSAESSAESRAPEASSTQRFPAWLFKAEASSAIESEQAQVITLAGRPGTEQLDQLREALQTGIGRLQMSAREGEVITIKMQLYPRDLGEVRVDIKLVGNTVTARFEAARPEAVQVIQENLQQLRSALDGQGFSQVSLGADSFGSFGQSTEHRFDRSPQRRHGSGPARGLGPDSAEQAATQANPLLSRVDYRL